MSEEGRALVTIEGLTVDYGRVRALDGITLEIRPGPVGLLGPNGAGKTTLLRVLLGFVDPSAGRALIGGCDPARRSERLELRRQVGYMPEGDCLFPGANAVELCGGLGRMSGLTRVDAMSRAHEVLDYVQIEEVRYRPALGYSTGLKQRLKLAQALVHDPELLLLDEPTNGLDPKARASMLDLISDLAENHGKSILLCSHLLPDVERTCHRVLVLARGRLVESGAIGDMTGTDASTVRVTVGGGAAAFGDALRARGLAFEEEAPTRFKVSLPVGDGGEEANADAVFAAAAAAGTPLTAVATARSSLEDVFLRILATSGPEGS